MIDAEKEVKFSNTPEGRITLAGVMLELAEWKPADNSGHIFIPGLGPTSPPMPVSVAVFSQIRHDLKEMYDRASATNIDAARDRVKLACMLLELASWVLKDPVEAVWTPPASSQLSPMKMCAALFRQLSDDLEAVKAGLGGQLLDVICSAKGNA